MGIFNFIFGKKEDSKKNAANDELLKLVEVFPGFQLPNALNEYSYEIEKTKCSFISIEAMPVEDLTLEESKFGHYPMLPLDFDYPKDSQGQYMYPLAQINFNDLPSLSSYPSTGYLQFYISGYDDAFGLNFDNAQSQKDFRVLYFENEEVEQHQTDFSFLDEVMKLDTLPLSKPHSLNFFIKEEYIGIGDAHYEKSEHNIEKLISARFPELEEELTDEVYDNYQSSGHKIGGYAHFAQDDPRSYNENLNDYILLLQIDTDEEIMWGDSGVANFFIHKEDLAGKNFSRVLYNWDCY